MKVLYDCQVFHNQSFGGISKYFNELFDALKGENSIEYDLALKYTNNTHITNRFGLKRKSYTDSNFRLLKKGSNRIYKYLNRRHSIDKINTSDFDLFHPTYYDPYFLKSLGKPFVLTVYDMTHEKFNLDSGERLSNNKRLLCENARVILAISENTKKDLIELLGVPPEKVVVTLLAGGFEGKKLNSSLAWQLPERYTLFVGNRMDYKNFDRFYEAYKRLMIKDETLHLVCTGPPFLPKEKSKFIEAGLNKRIIHAYPTDEQMYTYYSGALTFVFPSLYEGFGIPTLESFSADCPVILSNCSSLPEVGGDAAEYFDPYDIDSIESTIEKVVYDEKLRNAMVDKGNKQGLKFSWEKMAEDTFAAYKKAI